MRSKFLLIISMLSAIGLSAFAQNQCVPVLNTVLFNGRDLSSWEFFLKEDSIEPASVFYVKDAAIHISGTPFGYMRTKETFSNYKLHLEWRWPSEATNSGIFIHTGPDNAIWPACFEVQLKAGNAGDMICMGETDMNERTDKSSRAVKKLSASNEVSTGDWNTLEVICRENTIEVYINGTLQNKGTGLSRTQGSICLQSEGKDIEFRNLFVSKL